MVKQKFVVHYSSQVIRMVVHTIAGIIVARIAGPEILGIISYGTSYVAMFAIVLGFFGPSHIKLVSEGRDLGSCIKTYGVLQSSLILIYGLIFAVTFLSKKYYIGYDFGSNIQEIVIIILFFSIFIHQFLNIFLLTFGALTQLAKQSIPHLTEGIVHSILRIVVVVLGFGAIALSLSTLASTILMIPIVLYFFKDYPIGKFDFKLAKKYFSISIFFFIMSACGIIIHNFGKVFLKHYSSATEVGLYAGGYALAGMLMMLSTTSGTIFFPHFSRLISENKLDLIANQIHRYQRFVFVFIMPLVIIVSIFADIIITFVLGNRYIESIPILSTLILSSFIIIITLPYGNIITGSGRVKQAAILNVTKVAVFVGLLFVFVSDLFLDMGAVGLALVVLIIQLYSGIAYYLYSRTFFKYRFDLFTLKFLLIGTGFYLGLFLFKVYLIPEVNALIALLVALLFIITFYITVYLLKLSSVSDLKELVRLLSPSLSNKYIRSELNGSDRTK